jgi:hypothetical protein
MAWLPALEESATLEEAAQKGGRCIRDADDLVRRLTIEPEVELGLWPPVAPVGEGLELAATERAPGERGAPDRDADAGLPYSRIGS